MYFKNINIKNNKYINKIASTTFGILCIHANSDLMRKWLWKDTLNNIGAYFSNYTVIHQIVSILIVFVVCSIIDLLRQRFIEKPFFKWFDSKESKIINMYKNFESKIFH